MTGWRLLSRALPWLVAPALSIGACGRTDHATDDATAGQSHSTGATGATSPTGTTGGTTLLPGPVGGMTGRGGTEPVPPDDGGTGGTAPTMLPPGISDKPKTQMCAAEMCGSASVGPVFIDPCCTADGCGIETGFLALAGASFPDKCQARDQPGEVDANCPTSAPSSIPFQGIMVPISGFVGCCRDTGTCGVVVNTVSSPVLGNVAAPGLGCVDSAPFFGNKPGAACGSGAGGAGGAPAGGATGEAGALISAGGAP